MPPCTMTTELESLKNITKKLEGASANKIYKMTGCLASCNRNEYAIDSSPMTSKYCFLGPYDLHLDFSITKASYKEEEQYIIYDFNNFIGAVGGILGLCNLVAIGLIGRGVQSLHNQLANLLGRFKKQNSYQVKVL